MRIDVVTLFPEMFASVLGASILKRAAEPRAVEPGAGTSTANTGGAVTLDATPLPPPEPLPPAEPPVSYHLHNIRDYTTDKHSKVDRPPYGGGPGMVIQCQPVWDCVRAVEAMDQRPATRILMTPQGEKLTQKLVEELARLPRLLLIAGHYEGFDQRVIDALQPLREISIGDYVLTGGELPAMVVIDAVVRLIPGALGDDESAYHESFSSGAGGLLDYPHYTRPPVWMGREVPPILLSGNHAVIAKWRAEQARARTALRRPELIQENHDDTKGGRRHEEEKSEERGEKGEHQ